MCLGMGYVNSQEGNIIILFDLANSYYLHDIYCMWIPFMIYVCLGSTFWCRHSVGPSFGFSWVSMLALGKVLLFPPFQALEKEKWNLPAILLYKKQLWWIFSPKISKRKTAASKETAPDPLTGRLCHKTCGSQRSWEVKISWHFFQILNCMGCLHTFGSFPMPIHISIYIYECVVIYI